MTHGLHKQIIKINFGQQWNEEDWFCIYGCGRFYQRITREPFILKFVQSQTLSREKTFVQKMCV